MYKAMGLMHSQLLYAGDRLVQRARSQRGQGTVEYVALILVVALVMVGVVKALDSFDGGKELGNAIIEKIKAGINRVKY